MVAVPVALLRYALAVVVVTTMVAGTFVGKRLQETFNHPYATMWLSSAFVAGVTLAALPVVYAVLRRKHRGVVAHDGVAHAFRAALSASVNMSPLRLVLVCGPFAVLWVLANWLYVFALPRTSSSSALALEQCATVWVFVASAVVLRERVTVWRFLCVAVVVAGVVLVALADRSASTGNDGWVGDVLVVVSTVFTAAFIVAQKRIFDGLTFALLMVFLSCVSFWIVLAFWWPVLVLDATGLEPFAWPSGAMWGYLVGNSAIGLCFNVALNYLVLIASPIFVRLCIASTIPVSFIIDLIAHGAFAWLKLVGCLLILAGFVGYSIVLHLAARHEAPVDINDDEDHEDDTGRLTAAEQHQ